MAKIYEAEPVGPGPYNPPRTFETKRNTIAGSPEQKHISTDLMEPQNLAMWMSRGWLKRLRNAFLKKVENLPEAVALYFAHYDFVRTHKILRVTPDIEKGVLDRLWSLNDLVEQTRL